MDIMDTDYFNSDKVDEFKEYILDDDKNLEKVINLLYKYKIVNSKTYMAKILNDVYIKKIVNELDKWHGKKRELPLKNSNRKGIDILNTDTIKSNRREEIVCKLLYSIDRKHYIDYQVPLKPSGIKEDKGYGKIDLLYLEDNGDVRLIELKRYNSSENIVRAMLECCTYYMQLNKEKFIREYAIKGKIIPTVVVPKKMLDLLEKYEIYYKFYKMLNEKFNLELVEYKYNDQKYLEVENYVMRLDKNHLPKIF